MALSAIVSATNSSENKRTKHLTQVPFSSILYMQLLQRNKPTSLTCIHNIDYDMDWDSDEYLFKVNWDKQYYKHLELAGYRMHPLVEEILVYSKSLDFKTIYIARADDFNEVESF